MASNITLAGSINWAQPFCRYKPFLDTNNEPAFTNANHVMQTILGPPFTWRWNRATKTFSTIAGGTDYSVSVPDLGFLEKAVAAKGAAGQPRELTVKNVMALSNANEQDPPEHIGAVFDDNAGNITFRILPPTDGVYTVTLVYQKKPLLFVSTSQTWAPIPDEYAFVYNEGFLYKGYEFFDDPRTALKKQTFALSLLGISEGLDDTQKNLFLGKYLDTLKQEIRASAGASQSIQGRAV